MAAATPTPAMTPFEADLARFDEAFRALGAIQTDPDGFAWIDDTKVPAAMVSAYRRLMEHGYANGLLP